MSNNKKPSKLVSSVSLSGLSDESCKRFNSERLRFMQHLASTSEGRKVLRQGFPEIDMPAEAIEMEVENLSSEVEDFEHSETYRTVSDVARINAASIAIWDIHKTTTKAAAPHRYRARTKIFEKARAGHQFLDSKMRRKKDKIENWKVYADAWGWMGNLLNALAFCLVLSENIRYAAVIMGLRILITGICWSLISFPGDDSPEHPVLDSNPRISVLTHAGDMAIMFAIAQWLINDSSGDHFRAGVAVWLASIVMILGTVFRMATRAPRLLLERMARGSSICAALFLMSWSWEWAATVLILGPVCFAAIEAWESWKYLSEDAGNDIASLVVERFKDEEEPRRADCHGGYQETNNSMSQ